MLDALGEIVQCDRLDIGSPTLLHHSEEEGDDRDQDDQVDEAISKPLGVHAWWDPPGCLALYARAFDIPGFLARARAGAAVQAQDKGIGQNAHLDAIWQVIRPRGWTRLDNVERIVNRRSAHVDESANQRVEPAPQQASLQRTWLSAPSVQVVLDELGLWCSGEAGMEV